MCFYIKYWTMVARNNIIWVLSRKTCLIYDQLKVDLIFKNTRESYLNVKFQFLQSETMK